MMRKKFASMVLLLGLAFGPPALAARSDEIEAELRSLRTQLQLLENREESYRQEVLELKKLVDRVSQQAAGDQADIKAGLDEIRRRVETLEQKQQEISQQQEVIATRLQNLEDKLETELSEIKTRLDYLDGGRAEPTPGTAPAPAPANVKDYREVYQLALEQFRAKSYDAARAQFEAFLKAYPNTELSDNAQFGIGECYYALAQYDKAVLEYDKVRKNYPNGNKVPNALWKMALAFDRLGNRDVAKGFLKELTEKYPASAEADLAKKKLAAWK